MTASRWLGLAVVLTVVCAASPGARGVVVDLSGSHGFPSQGNIVASASTQLGGLSSLTTFLANPAANRFVYSFEAWPEATSSLGSNTYTFLFDLNGDGAIDQRVTANYAGSYAGSTSLTKANLGASAASPTTALGGLGDIGWGGSTWAAHTFTFETPVSAAGFVYRSPAAMKLQKIVYNNNSYPVSYKLSDGTVVNLGQSGVLGATIAAGANTFVGVSDATGKGIVELTVRVQGTSGGGQQVHIDDLAFAMAPEPAVANPINLRGSHDFRAPSNIAASASTQLGGLASLAEFRALAGGNRRVYSFNTWPTSASSLGSNTYTFQFDLDGDGGTDQRVTANYTGSYSGSTWLNKANLGNAASSPGTALGGLGDIGWGGSTWAAHTFAFEKPVTAAGFVYRSSSNLKLQKIIYNNNSYPVSYKLTDGTVVNLGSPGVTGATIPANTNTFVGVIDATGKGITELTVRVQGTASSSQSAQIDDLAFVLAGPPPGDWTLVFDENFNGSSLNTAVWSKGMRWAPIINNELQGYVPENVTVANGLCTIKAEKRTVRNTDMTGYQAAWRDYASGAIQTYNKWTHGHGYFEARVRMATGKGTWPAFWLLPDRGSGVTNLDHRVAVGNPAGLGLGNEIDIFEYMATWKDPVTELSKSHSGYFWSYASGNAWGRYAQDNDGNGPTLLYASPDTQFHTYGVYWGPGTLVFYIDGKVVLRRNDPATIGTVPHYLILNLAMTTNDWTGTPVPMADIDAGLPCTMDIDWVRVYSGTPAP